MNALIINLSKGQKIDLTAQMKDADEIFAAFKTYGVDFEKKYTRFDPGAPGTITFKSIRIDGPAARLSDLIDDLHGRAKLGQIGNVFLRFTGGWQAPKKEKTGQLREGEVQRKDLAEYGRKPEIYHKVYPKHTPKIEPDPVDDIPSGDETEEDLTL